MGCVGDRTTKRRKSTQKPREGGREGGRKGWLDVRGEEGREGGRKKCSPFSAGFAEASPFSYGPLGTTGGEVVVAPVVVLAAADVAATEGSCVGGREGGRA